MSDQITQRARLHLPIRLGLHHKWWIYAIFTALWLSGVIWLVFHFFIQVESNFGPRPHPLQHWWLRLHGLAAMLTLIALGSVLPQHIRRAWELARNLRLGITFTAVTIWLAITGYALYYFVTEANQVWLSWLHWVPGIIFPLALWLHIRRGRARTMPHAATVQTSSYYVDMEEPANEENRTGTSDY